MSRSPHVGNEAMETRRVHVVTCAFCHGQFDLFGAPWCRHGKHRSSKACPHCRQCLCSDPRSEDPRLWVAAPLIFQRHGFLRLFISYL